MPELRNLQQAFLEDVITGTESAVDYIAHKDFTPEQRLKIYRNNTQQGLIETLESTFPLTAKAVGEDFFKYTAIEFIKELPPKNGNLFHYGKEFPNFLAGFEPVVEFRFLPDLAQLEWHIETSYYAANKEVISPESLNNISPNDVPELTFELHPATILFKSQWALDDIVHHIETGTTPDNLKPAVPLYTFLIYRKNFNVTYTRLSYAEAVFLQTLQAGETFETAHQRTIELDAQVNISQILSDALKNSLFTNITKKERE